MKLILVLSFFAFLFATAQASTKATNAHRLARGLPPIAPQRLYVPSNVNAATKSTPSGTSSSTCSTNLLCCETIGSNSDSHYKDLATSCGAKLSGSQSGATCSKLSSASAQCSHKKACCASNHDGILATDCKEV